MRIAKLLPTLLLSLLIITACGNDPAAIVEDGGPLVVDGAPRPDADVPTVFVEHCGTIAADETWGAEDNHLVTCDIVVEGDGAPTLTITAGARVYFAEGTGLRVGVDLAGGLQVAGADGSPVMMTSASDTPTPGDWTGIELAALAEPSAIDFADIGFGGLDSFANLIVSGSSLTLTNSTIHHSLGNGLVVRTGGTISARDNRIEDNLDDGLDTTSDAMIDGEFSGNVFTTNGGAPVRIPLTLAPTLDGNTYSGNASDFVFVHGGIIDTSTTWVALDVPYWVLDDIDIAGAAAPMLTLEAGVELVMDFDTALRVSTNVDPGGLTAAGTEAAPVVIRGAIPILGSWQGITGSIKPTVLTLNHTTVSDAKKINVQNATTVITNSTLRDFESEGIDVRTGTLVMTDTTIDNTERGVYFGNSARLAAAFTNNVVSPRNAYYAMYLHPADLVDLDASSELNGDVVIRGGILDYDHTLVPFNGPYSVANNQILTVDGASSPTLTIPDGMFFRMNSQSKIVVDNGRIVADGSTQGITIGFGPTLTNTLFWKSMEFNSGDTGSVFTNVDFRNGGHGNAPTVRVNGSSPTFTNCSIGYGHIGVQILGGGTPTVTGTTFHNNNIGLMDSGVGHTAAGWFENNTLTTSAKPAELYANTVGQISATNSISGNTSDIIRVLGGDINDTATWPDHGDTYFVISSVNVQNSAVLTIAPGVDLSFFQNTGITVGTIGNGGLHLAGTAQAPITIAGSAATPGYWSGIEIGSKCIGTDLSATYTTISHGGGNDLGNLAYSNCAADIILGTDLTLNNSSWYGVYATGYTGITFTNVTGSGSMAGLTNVP